MAKLQIKGKSLLPRDLEILIDGVKIKRLKSLDLTIESGEANECRISFYVDDVEVDTEVLAELEARMKRNKQAEAPTPEEMRKIARDVAKGE